MESLERFNLLHTVCRCTHRGKFLKVLHLWEPMSTATCKGNLPWNHSLVAKIPAPALMGISACGKLLVVSLVLLGSLAWGQEMEECPESPEG